MLSFLTVLKKKKKKLSQATSVAALTRPSPVTLTAANKSFPPQIHAWLPPNKNTTLGAIGRTVGAVTNSTDPLNATKAVAQGLALYKQETRSLILGQAGIASFASSLADSGSTAADLRCFVDPATGQLVGLEQAGSVACSTASDVVVVPTATSAAGAYISQVKLAYTYDGAFVGRLVFYLKANATAKESVAFACGSAGGKAVELLPNGADFAVTTLNVGCAALPVSSSGRRLRAAALTSGPGLGLSAGNFGVVAAPLDVLPVSASGVPLTQPIGNVLVPGGGPSPPGPSPPPSSPPTVSMTTTAQLINANTLVITGSNFDASNPAANVVVLSDGAVGVVTAATATTLTVTLSQLPTNTGPLTAVVTTGLGASGAPVQVAAVAFPSPSGLPATSPWRGIAMSNDGTKMAAVAATGNIWLSSDRGATWTANSGTTGAPSSAVYVFPSSSSLSFCVSGGDGTHLFLSPRPLFFFSSPSLSTFFLLLLAFSSISPFPNKKNRYVSVAMSGDGTKILAAENNAATGKLYLSVDSGATWTPQSSASPFPTTATWNAVAMSSSGSVLAAGVDSSMTGKLYLSRDMGTTWVEQAGGLPSAARYTSITISDDGNKIAVATFSTSGDVYYTTDGGSTWLVPAGAPTATRWQAIASSADGTKLIAGDAATATGDLWLSGDSGASFASQAAGLTVPSIWRAVAASSGFTRLAAAVQSSGGVYLSSSSGAAFSLATGGGLPTSASWRSLAMSADGSVIAAIGTNQVWVTYDAGITWYQR